MKVKVMLDNKGREKGIVFLGYLVSYTNGNVKVVNKAHFTDTKSYNNREYILCSYEIKAIKELRN